MRNAMILCILAGIANGPGLESGKHRSNQELELVELLEQSRLAVFGDQPAPDLRLDGVTTQYGIESEFQFFQSKTGKYRREISGALPVQQGFNGEVAWENDWCHSTRILDFADRDRWHLINLIHFGGWLLAESQLQFELDQASSTADCYAVRIRFHPDSESATLLVNRDSFLPYKLLLASSFQKEEVVFDDFRREGGVAIAHETSISIGDDRFTQKVTGVQLASELPDFDPPPTSLSNIVFSETNRELNIKRALSGHVLVNLSFNENEPVWFIFDTGAGGTIVDRELVSGMQLKPAGSMNVLSIFGLEPSNIVRLDKVDLGAVRLDSLYALDMDLSFLEPALGEKISGIIGYDLLSKCIAEIRLTDDRISVHDPNKSNRELHDWHPLQLDRRLPLIPARVNDLPFELFRIDVGAAGEFFSNVVIHTPYARAENLAEQFGISEFKLPPHEFAVGTLPRFQFAGKAFVDAQVGFARSDTAPFNDVYSRGNVGVEFLKPFVVILDYSNRRYATEPIDEAGSK